MTLAQKKRRAQHRKKLGQDASVSQSPGVVAQAFEQGKWSRARPIATGRALQKKRMANRGSATEFNSRAVPGYERDGLSHRDAWRPDVDSEHGKPKIFSNN